MNLDKSDLHYTFSPIINMNWIFMMTEILIQISQQTLFLKISLKGQISSELGICLSESCNYKSVFFFFNPAIRWQVEQLPFHVLLFLWFFSKQLLWFQRHKESCFFFFLSILYIGKQMSTSQNTESDPERRCWNTCVLSSFPVFP